MARKTLTDRGVAALKPRAKRYFYPDPQLVGHYVRISQDGRKVFYAQARAPDGKQKWIAIGPADAITIEHSREQAREVLKRLRAGQTAREEQPDTFRAVAENFMARHVRAQGLISAGEIERSLRVYVLPSWADRPFVDIKRADISKLLDHIEDKYGGRMADIVLAILRKMANWYETRDDNFVSPYRRGMSRQGGKAQARARIFDDAELRAVWKAAEANGPFGAFVRLALLTGQRRDKVASMKWEHITIDGEWRIATEAREKGTAGSLVLPPVALEIIRAQPRLGDNSYIFAGRGSGPIAGWSVLKCSFDAKLPDVKPWTIHDLRRTARSLMSRASVRPDIAERVLGHVQQGVLGTYDRHSYQQEKADALARLATLIESIVHPRANVVPMAKQAKRR